MGGGGGWVLAPPEKFWITQLIMTLNDRDMNKDHTDRLQPSGISQ